MSVYLVSGGKNKDRELKIHAMMTELLGSDYEKTVDCKIIDLEEGKKNISIDQIRLIEDFSISRPIERSLKMILVKNADKLSIEAQNAMLKTLEEPPVYLKFILEASRANSLLKTVISRCILIELGSSESIDLETAENASYVDEFVKILTKNTGARFDWAVENKDLFKEAQSLIACLDMWEIFLRDVLVFNSVEKNKLKNKYKINDVESAASLFTNSLEVENVLRRILQAKSAARSNVNKSLILENFLISLPYSNV